jgi:hypothetical protein
MRGQRLYPLKVVNGAGVLQLAVAVLAIDPGDRRGVQEAERWMHQLRLVKPICLNGFLGVIPPTSRNVIILHFGLSDGVVFEPTEIGTRLRINPETARRCIVQALARLRTREQAYRAWLQLIDAPDLRSRHEVSLDALLIEGVPWDAFTKVLGGRPAATLGELLELRAQGKLDLKALPDRDLGLLMAALSRWGKLRS